MTGEKKMKPMQEEKKNSPYGIKFTLTIFDELGNSFVCQSKIFDTFDDAVAYQKENHNYKVQIGTIVLQPRPVQEQK
jgi:C4-type Zn-finger protein